MKINLPKLYIDFIEECKSRNYESTFIHKHHIIPKFMGGTDDCDNLIFLNIEDHLLAHKILAENVEEQYKRKAWDSVVILKKGWGGNTDSILENLRQQNTAELNPFYGKVHTNDTKKRMSESHPYPFRGKSYTEYYGNRSDEIKLKISKSKDKFKKKILQFDLDNNFIKEWDSIRQIKNKLKIYSIGMVCQGRNKTAGGYKWKYKINCNE